MVRRVMHGDWEHDLQLPIGGKIGKKGLSWYGVVQLVRRQMHRKLRCLLAGEAQGWAIALSV